MQALGVLTHLKRGDSDAAGVCSFRRGEKNTLFQEVFRRIERRRHVRAFADRHDAVRHKSLDALDVKLALRRAGQGDVALDRPDATASLVVLGIRTLFDVLLDAAAAHLLNLLDECEVDALGVIDVAVRVRAGHGLCAEFDGLFNRIRRDVARAGDDDGLALKALAVVFEHLLHEVEESVARGFRACEAAAVAESLAREDSGIKGVDDALVLTVEVADLTAADADVACRRIDHRADVAIELRHEALAEAHDLVVALALRVEIRAALGAADGKPRQRVLERLLESEELQNGERHARMETQAALVGADGAVRLHAVAAVDLNLALVVLPRHAEHDDALRLDHALKDLVLLVLGMLLQDRHDRGQDFFDHVVIFLLLRILLFDRGEDVLYILLHFRHAYLPLCFETS